MAQISGGLMDFVQRFQALQLQRDSAEELMKDLLVYAEKIESALRNENNQLVAELKDSKLDLDHAVKSRRELQMRLQEAEAQASFFSQGVGLYRTRNQYILVLIDGDGLYFKQDLISQGVEGGKKAAIALKALIMKQCGEHAGDMDVVAKVVANLSGLSKAMWRDGSLHKETDLRDFFIGFSQGKATFDFVDIGPGKERADSKIRELAKRHMRNYNCRQVVLGVSHDSGYAPFLDEALQDAETKGLITILEGFPTVREIAATGVNIVNFTETLFRSDKLVDRLPPKTVTPPVAVAPPPVLTPTPTPGPISAPPSYAGVIQNASPPPTLNLPLAAKPPLVSRSAPAKPPQWNPGARGLDPPIQVNQAALDSIKKRKDNHKLCNNHYLRGPCAKGDSCCFEHKYKPTPEEKVAIAFLARLNPCTNGQDCDVEDCIYGHHCPSTINGQCTHPYCKFRPDEHPTGTKYRPTYRNGDYSS